MLYVFLPLQFILLMYFSKVIIVFSLVHQVIKSRLDNNVLTALALAITFIVNIEWFKLVHEYVYKPYQMGEMSFLNTVKLFDVYMNHFVQENMFFFKEQFIEQPESVWYNMAHYSISQITEGIYYGVIVFIVLSLFKWAFDKAMHKIMKGVRHNEKS